MDEAELFESLATRLRDAHRRVATAKVPDEEKASITRRLLVISDASKHSLTRASERLDRYLAELDARLPPENDGA